MPIKASIRVTPNWHNTKALNCFSCHQTYKH
ncbi:CxxxxCH/CxxCH domain-containing protein [Aerosakkonemataceae cyanobacterium BLCC-F167]|uniref:CxxxxCH/CxxCH domain-containing protein n=1 Tax=Floridaenema evergladense BLCC-F167 TaxID=3153639 RepID=A0ABV4WVS4_9CYAN